MAKAPSLRKDWTRGTQRTRKLSTGKALWSWRNGKERFVRARRGTAGAKPYTMKVVRTVFNGGHEETYGNATRLVPTQQLSLSRLWYTGPPMKGGTTYGQCTVHRCAGPPHRVPRFHELDPGGISDAGPALRGSAPSAYGHVAPR